MQNSNPLTKRQLEQAEALKRNLQRRKAQRMGRRNADSEKPQPGVNEAVSPPLSSAAQDAKTVE